MWEKIRTLLILALMCVARLQMCIPSRIQSSSLKTLKWQKDSLHRPKCKYIYYSHTHIRDNVQMHDASPWCLHTSQNVQYKGFIYLLSLWQTFRFGRRDTQSYLTWKRIIGMTVLGLLRTMKDKAHEETQVTCMRREIRGRQDETSK